MGIISTKLHAAMARDAASAASDDRLAAWAIKEYKSGHLDRECTVEALRVAGRFEAEIREALEG